MSRGKRLTSVDKLLRLSGLAALAAGLSSGTGDAMSLVVDLEAAGAATDPSQGIVFGFYLLGTVLLLLGLEREPPVAVQLAQSGRRSPSPDHGLFDDRPTSRTFRARSADGITTIRRPRWSCAAGCRKEGR
jgi:hypothetical protein